MCVCVCVHEVTTANGIQSSDLLFISLEMSVSNELLFEAPITFTSLSSVTRVHCDCSEGQRRIFPSYICYVLGGPICEVELAMRMPALAKVDAESQLCVKEKSERETQRERKRKRGTCVSQGKGNHFVASGHLLLQVSFPDAVRGQDRRQVVTLTTGLVISERNDTVREVYYVALGTLT